VLATTDAVGGVWSYSLTLATALAAHGVRTTLAVLGPAPAPAQRAEAAAVPGLALLHGDYRLEWMDDPWDDVARAGAWLREVAAAVQPDVVHLNGYALAAEPWPAPVVVVAHSCVLSWWEAVRGEPAPPTWDAYERVVARGVRAADLVVAPTRAMLSEVVRRYGVPRAAAVVHNAAPADAPAGIPKEPLVFCAARLWDEAKNVAALDAAAAHAPWPVYVAGDARRPGGASVELRHVTALGPLPRDATAAWMARASVYALPARYEPFGLSVLEAARARCALVLGDVASLRELWEGAAVFVAPGDHGALAATLARLAASPAERAALAAAACERATGFTPERTAREYHAHYARLVREAACA
jgi:glycosyltransferase involved in cell wall biosynthesis